MASQRVLIVGGGIIGATYAFALARRGAHVTLMEEGDVVGGEATRNSWAWINASWGNAPDYFKLRAASMKLWRDLDRDVPGLSVQWHGGLLWDLPDNELEAYVQERIAQGYDIRLVDGAEAQRLEPQLKHVPKLAAHAPCEASVEPVHAVEQMLAAARFAGATVMFGQRVKRLHDENGRVAGVVTNEGVLDADAVVLATGAGTSDLLSPFDVALPLNAVEGLLVYSEPAPEMLRGLVLAPELHVRQRTDGALIAGSDFGGTDPGADAEHTARMLFAKVQDMLRDGQKLAFGGYSIGYRPTPRDGFSIVGRISELPGVYVAVTHSGITLAPALAAFGAEDILFGQRHDLLLPFGPDRFKTRVS